MVALRRRPKSERDPLTKVEQQLTDLREQLLKSKARLQECRYELDSLASKPDERAQQLSDLRCAIAKAQQDRAALEEYSSLLSGHQDAGELEEARIHIEELNKQLEATEAAHLKIGKERKDREATLRAELHTQEKTIADLDSRLRATLAAKERLQGERGAALLAECDVLLTDAERLEEEYRERYEQCRRVTATARANAIQRLEAYPALLRELKGRHCIQSDATAEALQAMIHLLSLLANSGYEVEQARGGMMGLGVHQMISEFELEMPALLAAGAGDPHVLEVKRQRLEQVLRQYRANLARQ